VIVDQVTWINGDAVLEASNTSIRINRLVASPDLYLMIFRCALM